MTSQMITLESDLIQKLKWLIMGRFLFAVLLLGSTILLQSNEVLFSPTTPLLILYIVISGLLFLSLIYYLILSRIRKNVWLAYTQLIADTFFVTLIIYITGGFLSIFSFLYPVVIIYSSILLYRKGSVFIAALCSFQYFILVQFEYMGILKTFLENGDPGVMGYSGNQVFYKTLITVGACFAVAFLSSILSEQARKSKKELIAMEEHIKRVEKMAYMGEIAANLAHEIKNPLASLAGSIQLLREEVKYDPDHDKLMRIVLRETDRLSSLASNFLLFARLPTGKLEKIALDRALSETVELFEKDNTFIGRINVDHELSSGIWVLMDSMHLRQVMLNLLLNAAEAIESKGTIKLKMYPVKDNFAEITIVDNGCGMSDDIINSIFDPFFTTKSSGTGLGLSIVHNMLKTYDSRLDVESKVDQGTRLCFKLKRTEPPLSANLTLTPEHK